MNLTNAQYNEIMREYSRRQNASHRLQEQRREQIYREIPQMHELDALAGSLGLSCARSMLADPAKGEDVQEDRPGLDRFRRQMKTITRERMRLLIENGYPEDYLEPVYTCADCRDTGYTDGKMCHCFRQNVIDLFYTQSGLRSALSEENFGSFRLDLYPNEPVIPSVGKTPRTHMRDVLRQCHSFIDTFDTAPGNLLFYGETGLGKTFLSHCIAAELLETGHSVLYYSSEALFRALGSAVFGRTDSFSPDTADENTLDLSLLFSCDLLIIDDLGTEIVNSFVASQLFRLLNERILNHKSTLISTNLSLAQLSALYSERIMSRITSSFTLLAFFGNDIRLLKKLKK